MPKLRETLFGKKGKIKKKSTLTPDQENLMSLINEGLTSGEGPFGDIFGEFNEDKFNEGVANPALKKFQEETLPLIQEKFIAGNQALGSGMRRGQLKASKDFQGDLAQLMYQAQQDQQKNRMGGIQALLGTKAFENVYQPGTTGIGQTLFGSVGNAIGSAIGSKIGSLGSSGATPGASQNGQNVAG